MSVTVNGVPLHRFLGSCPPSSGFTPARCDCGAILRSDGRACTGAGRHPAPAASVQLYATWTGTRRNLAALHAGGFRLFAGPDQLDRLDLVPPLAYALDNGAWGAFQRGVAFDRDAFWHALDRWGEGADFIVLPDIVAGGLRSLELSLAWLFDVRQYALPMLAVQDGMKPEDVEEVVGPGCGIFLGGSTAWKWATLPSWAVFAKLYRAPLHVGRGCNSQRQIRKCAAVGASSADGTSATVYSVNAAPLAAVARELAQPLLPLWTAA